MAENLLKLKNSFHFNAQRDIVYNPAGITKVVSPPLPTGEEHLCLLKG